MAQKGDETFIVMEITTFNEINFSQEHSANKDWYSPGEIRFRKWEVEWVLSHLDQMKVGLWPIKGVEDAAPSGRAYTHAYFEKPVEIAAEVEWRLEQTGQAGAIAREYYNGKNEIEIGRLLNLDPFDVLKRVQKALSYMSGWNRKRSTYKEWLGHRRMDALDRVLECLLGKEG